MKVFDCFSFFNELTVLDIRLNTLDEAVDTFILVESRFSHQNKPKPLYYEENKHLFERFNHKIHHIIVDEFTDHTYWGPEAEQRDKIMLGVNTLCSAEDIVFVSDVDEIWNPDTIFTNIKDIDSSNLYKWRSKICYYYFNYLAREQDWIQPFFAKASLIKNFCCYNSFSLTSDIMRNNGKHEINEVVLDEIRGWHFSYTENPEYKVQNFLHSEYTNLTNEHFNNCLKQNINPFTGGKMTRLAKDDTTHTLPQYVSSNLERYEKYFL
jgi:beta-1,4-mannosyl-glycoprotein beta-1,4-N-acetylglucosaminyltransferase